MYGICGMILAALQAFLVLVLALSFPVTCCMASEGVDDLHTAQILVLRPGTQADLFVA